MAARTVTAARAGRARSGGRAHPEHRVEFLRGKRPVARRHRAEDLRIELDLIERHIVVDTKIEMFTHRVTPPSPREFAEPQNPDHKATTRSESPA